MATFDLKALVPRIRRATGNTTLPEDAAVAAAADAIARVILYTGSFFGHTLTVTDRDTDFGAPTKWELEAEPAPAEIEVIAIQAALDTVATSITELTSQTIKNEGREWTWAKSSTAATERFKALIADRDRALEAIEDAQGGNLTYYVDYVAERDRQLAYGIDQYFRGPLALLGQ